MSISKEQLDAAVAEIRADSKYRATGLFEDEEGKEVVCPCCAATLTVAVPEKVYPRIVKSVSPGGDIWKSPR